MWRRLRGRGGVGRIIFKYLLGHDVEKRSELFCMVQIRPLDGKLEEGAL